jgi:hypothetical protein
MLRLSALAMTPTILLSTLLMAAGLPALWTIIGIVVVFTYLAMMVNANTVKFPGGAGGAGAGGGPGAGPQSYVVTPG